MVCQDSPEQTLLVRRRNSPNAEVNRALADPKMRERLAELGGKPIPGTPDDFGRVIAAETLKWEKVVNVSGAKPD